MLLLYKVGEVIGSLHQSIRLCLCCLDCFLNLLLAILHHIICSLRNHGHLLRGCLRQFHQLFVVFFAQLGGSVGQQLHFAFSSLCQRFHLRMASLCQNLCRCGQSVHILLGSIHNTTDLVFAMVRQHINGLLCSIRFFFHVVCQISNTAFAFHQFIQIIGLSFADFIAVCNLLLNEFCFRMEFFLILLQKRDKTVHFFNGLMGNGIDFFNFVRCIANAIHNFLHLLGGRFLPFASFLNRCGQFIKLPTQGFVHAANKFLHDLIQAIFLLLACNFAELFNSRLHFIENRNQLGTHGISDRGADSFRNDGSKVFHQLGLLLLVTQKLVFGITGRAI